MFKHQLVGRLGSFLSVVVLASACAGGEISDLPGGRGLDVGFHDGALTCPGVNPDVSASDGWQSKQASQPAPDTLYFEVMARPTEANLDALVAVGAQDIHDFSDAAIAVRFSDTGIVDVMDDSEYGSDGYFEYDPGVWYEIAISADVTARTYDVEVGRCGEKRRSVIRGARFRSAANVYDRLSAWGVWSSRLDSLQLSTPTWMASGTCAPATCEGLGAECGQPSDGCNGTLNCGVCGGGQLCSSGTCVDEPVSVPPPPSCTPASCQSLGAECGAPSDGCGGTLNCGGCSAGQLCSNNVCIDQPVIPPPPPVCVPTTCQALGAECGTRSNGCGGTLNCGGCGAGQTCSSSICIDQPVTPPPPPVCVPTTCQALGAECGTRSDGCGGGVSCGSCSAGETCNGSGQCVTGTNWWEIIPKPDATNTGPNCSAPGCPSATLSAGNAPPATVTQNGATYENFTFSGGNIAIKAANVTFRNFLITGAGAGGGTGVEVLSGGSNFLMEYGEMVGGGGCGQLMDGNGYTARYTQFHQCDDIIKINNGTDGNRGPVLVENSYWYDAGGGHGDTIQIWDETDSDITFRHNHLIAGETSVVIDWAINAPAGLLFEENWVHGVGGYYAIYCSSDGGGERLYQNNLFDRNWAGSVAVDAGCTWINNSYMDNFAPVPRN